MTQIQKMHPSGCAATRQKLLRHLTDEREMLLCDAMRIIGSRDRAEDVVQDAAIRCLNSAAVGADIASHRGFLRKIVRNLALDQLRRDGRERASPLEPGDELPCTMPSVEKKLSDAQVLQQILKGLATLPEREIHIFLAHRLGFERQKDIAQRLGLSPARINGIISMTHRTLKGYTGSTPAGCRIGR